jgi:hypothetical protein
MPCGEHPFFRHETVVAYNQCAKYDVATIEECLADGTFVPREACSPALLERVVAGISTSPFTPKYIGLAVKAARGSAD